jgi:hypothetical protein
MSPRLLKHLRTPTCVLAIVLTCAACAAVGNPPAATGPASQPAAPKEGQSENATPLVMDGPLSFDLDTLVDAVALTGHQTRNLETQFDAMEDAVAEWDQEHTEALDGFEAIVGQLQQSKNIRELQYVFEKYHALLEERTKLVDSHKQPILAALTAEQRTAWEAAKFRADVESRLGNVELTDDQLDKVKALCTVAAKSLLGLKDPADPRNFISHADTLWQTVRSKVLSDDQRKTLDNPDTAM